MANKKTPWALQKMVLRRVERIISPPGFEVLLD
jgi:hypothetical protein